MSLITAARRNAEGAVRSAGQASVVSHEIRRAEEDLARQLRGRLRDAKISMHPEGVVLHGRTSTYYVKQLAQHAVMKNVSVPIADNKIEVTLPPLGRQA